MWGVKSLDLYILGPKMSKNIMLIDSNQLHQENSAAS